MTSVLFEEIYSHFLLKTEPYELFAPEMTEDIRNELLCGFVHSASADPFVRQLFSVVWLSDPILGEDEAGELFIDGLLEYEMNIEENEYSDKEFVLDVLSDGMVLAWIDKTLNSSVNMLQFIGASDTKFYSAANHIQALRDMRNDIALRRDHMIAARDFIHNDYLNGNISNMKGSTS